MDKRIKVGAKFQDLADRKEVYRIIEIEGRTIRVIFQSGSIGSTNVAEFTGWLKDKKKGIKYIASFKDYSDEFKDICGG